MIDDFEKDFLMRMEEIPEENLKIFVVHISSLQLFHRLVVLIELIFEKNLLNDCISLRDLTMKN
jgi:hypothetical protein